LERQGTDAGQVRQLIENFRSLLTAALDDLAQASKDQ
jgi:hypothetical protein